MRPSVTLAVVLLLVSAGCLTTLESGTPTAAGEVAAEVTTDPPSDVTPQLLSTVDDEFVREAVKRAVTVYEQNKTAERVVVAVPKPSFGETQDVYRQLPKPSDESFRGRVVVYRNTTVRVYLIEYA